MSRSATPLQKKNKKFAVSKGILETQLVSLKQVTCDQRVERNAPKVAIVCGVRSEVQKQHLRQWRIDLLPVEASAGDKICCESRQQLVL